VLAIKFVLKFSQDGIINRRHTYLAVLISEDQATDSLDRRFAEHKLVRLERHIIRRATGYGGVRRKAFDVCGWRRRLLRRAFGLRLR
jgi:hypothetical protein